jgi:hypothetical protein
VPYVQGLGKRDLSLSLFPSLEDRVRDWARLHQHKNGCIKHLSKFHIFSTIRSGSGWPDWANFRLWVGCFISGRFFGNDRSRLRNLAYFFPLKKLHTNFGPNTVWATFWAIFHKHIWSPWSGRLRRKRCRGFSGVEGSRVPVPTKQGCQMVYCQTQNSQLG